MSKLKSGLCNLTFYTSEDYSVSVIRYFMKTSIPDSRTVCGCAADVSEGGVERDL